MDVLILLPVFNDWISAAELLRRLDRAFASSEDFVSVLFVDDGSSEMPPPDFAPGPYQKLTGISCLVLKKNVGHQRALAIGLCHVGETIASGIVVIMDSDGEDEATDARRLVERVKELPKNNIVFAERIRRSESGLFKFFYLVYRMLHWILTGQKIRFGNFSALPFSLVPAVTIEPTLWNHYAASIVHSRIPFQLIQTSRGKRIAGKSRLNFVRLIVHGLSALACYNEVIGVRLLLFLCLPCAAAALALALVIGLKMFSTLAIPGWASIVSILILVLLMQTATLIINFVMQAISTRTLQPVIPIRDYRWFILKTVRHFPPPHDDRASL